MRKKILYLIAFVLSMSLYASSKDCIMKGKGHIICKKQIKEILPEAKSISGEGMFELSPVPHFLLFET